MTTHYIPPFTRVNGRKQEAACQAWVEPRDHSNEPTCPQCAAYLQQDASDTRKAVEVFGEEAQRLTPEQRKALLDYAAKWIEPLKRELTAEELADWREKGRRVYDR